MFCNLAKRLFVRNDPKNRDKFIIKMLQTRAWISFAGFNIVRIYMLASNIGSWYRRHTDCSDLETAEITPEMNCVYIFNSDLMPTSDFFRWVLICLLMSTMIISILCYKWRNLANLCLYFECVIRTVSWFIPNEYNE